MTRNRMKTWWLLVAVAMAAGLALPGPGAAQDRQLTRIRVVHVPVLIFAPLYVAIERGYFAQQRLEVELISTPGGASSFAVLASGRAEAVVGGLGAALFNAAARGLDFKVVGPVHMEKPPVSTPLVVSKRVFESGEIKSVRDLRGKRVSINVIGSATEFWLHAALLKGGLTINDVQMVAVNFPDVPAALANGAIAAGLLGEPLATLAEERGQIVRLADDFINGIQVTALYFSGAFIREHPDLATGFMVAWLRASRDLYGDGYRRDDVARIVEKYTSVPADVVKKARPPFHEPDGKMNFNDFKRLQEFFRKRGSLTYEQPLPPAAYIDTTFVRRALQTLGPFRAP